jgi:hypothetical protein
MNIPSDDDFLHTISSASPPKQLGMKEYKTGHVIVRPNLKLIPRLKGKCHTWLKEALELFIEEQ